MQAGEREDAVGRIERPATMDNWDALFGFVQSEAKRHLNGHSKEYGLMLACEELISNMIRYNGSRQTHDGQSVSIRILSRWVEGEGHRLFRFEISDDGPSFDPHFEAIAAAVEEVPIEKRPIGGLGLFLIKTSVDQVAYVHSDHRNIYSLDTDPAIPAAVSS
jgi:anti-sigma regulatory factor (Ser/Thr protein kinase)